MRSGRVKSNQGGDGMHEMAEAAKEAAKASGKGLDLMSILLGRMRGIGMGSAARGTRARILTALGTVDSVKAWAIESGLSADDTNALCNGVMKLLLSEANISSAIDFCSAAMRGREGDPDSIGHGWFLRWEDGAGSESDAEMQEVWGRILAGELEQPGSFSKRTLSIVSDMGRDDAESFRVFCSLCAGGVDGAGVGQPTIPLLFLDGGGTSYNDGALSYREASRLEALGLVRTGVGTRFEAAGRVILCIGGTSYRVVGDGGLSIGDAGLTVYGEELSRLCEIGSADGLLAASIRELGTKGLGLSPFVK